LGHQNLMHLGRIIPIRLFYKYNVLNKGQQHTPSGSQRVLLKLRKKSGTAGAQQPCFKSVHGAEEVKKLFCFIFF